jgi:TolB-like protein/Flp pilus assembly protein TadD
MLVAPMGTPVASRLRFGMFEVDPRSGELLRQGSRIKLQNQPFQALTLLLESPGEVVTREEFRRRLWPGTTYGDFDCALNKAINGLRAALGDRAARPRFVETLPRRGYRFVARVEAGRPATGYVGSARHADLPRIDSLAVLPLENLSGDPSQEYFCDGMTEELISAIARIGEVRVISRTSVMAFKGTRKSLPDIAKELRVQGIVEASVARSEQRVRITAQLIHAPEDRHLWSGRYERELRDVLRLQAEVAQDITRQIRSVVVPEHARPITRVRQVHPQAFEAWLKGNHFRDRMTPADLEKSVGFFTTATSLDPEYAQAYADLSQVYFYLGLHGVRHPAEMFSKASASAVRALELDETIAAARNALAVTHILRDWDWASAEAECRRGAELNPGDYVIHARLADYMSIRGRHDEAIEEAQRVLQVNPISRVYLGWYGLILHRARRYDESIAQCRKALEIDPTYANALWFLALSMEQKGELREAIGALKRAAALSAGPHHQAQLGRVYGIAGEKTKALNILRGLSSLSRRRYVSPFDLAVVHAGLGDLTALFERLEEAYEQRVFRIIELTLPMFDGLRCDPRWQALVQRLGLRDLGCPGHLMPVETRV